MLSTDITVSFAGKELIKPSRIVINPKQKYIVLGVNGIGKTSLITAILTYLPQEQYIYVNQDIVVEPGETCLDFLLKSNTECYKIAKEIDALVEDDDDTYDLTSAYEKLDSLGWDRFVATAYKILHGMGFKDKHQLTQTLSGGWRMRLAISKALLNEPTLLVLDEPTNHLDLEATIWLTNYLENYKKTLIIITHQIDLIGICDKIWYIGNLDLDGNRVYTINGSDYSSVAAFLKQKYIEKSKDYDKFQNKLMAFKNKKPSPTKIQTDEYKKTIEVARPPLPYQVSISWDSVAKLNRNIVKMEAVSYSYTGASAATGAAPTAPTAPTAPPIFQDATFYIHTDSRYVLVGPNGAGKTTLFRLIMGNIVPDKGVIIRDERLRIGYYNQQIIDGLPLDQTPTEFLMGINPELSVGDCKGILGRLSLKKTEIGDPTAIKIGLLSGGQKARVAFARLQLDSPHLLLLDEPTNHLDIETVHALVESINAYNGAVVIITHDIYFIKHVQNTTVFAVGDGDVNKVAGGFDEYYQSIVNAAN